MYNPFYRPSYPTTQRFVDRRRQECTRCHCADCDKLYNVSVNDRSIKTNDKLLNDIGQICVDQLQSDVSNDNHIDAFKRILNMLGVKYDKPHPKEDEEWKQLQTQLAYKIVKKLFGLDTQDKPSFEPKEEPKQEVKEEKKPEPKVEDIKINIKTVNTDNVNKLLNDMIGMISPATAENTDATKLVNNLCQLFFSPQKPSITTEQPKSESAKHADAVLDEFLTTLQ